MKLNEKKITKALEFLASEHDKICRDCPYNKRRVRKYILSYIEELTASIDRLKKQCGEIIVECDERDAERLKEVMKLTAEIERLKNTLDVTCAVKRTAEAKLEKAEHDRDRYARKIRELTAENERLRCENAKKYVDAVDARAPIVRKMHSLIKERCIAGGIYPAFVARVVDEAAEEVLYEN